MTRKIIFLTGMIWLALCCCQAGAVEDQVSVPVLVYHRFGRTVADGMTVTTRVFEAQLQWLKDNGYTIIPLHQLVNYLQGQGPPPPPQSVVITGVPQNSGSMYVPPNGSR